MNNNIRHILIRYITGNASAEETALAREWIATSKQNEMAYIRLYEDWHKALSSKHHLIDTEKAYDRFLRENTAIAEPVKTFNGWYKYAAAILLVCSIGMFFYLRKPATEPSWNEIIVAKGEKKNITLPDGTSVFINADSKLRYNKDFGVDQRNVELDGEARFDIAESKDHIPFIVNAAGFTIRDIGTIFNVKAYSEDDIFETSVIDGEVSVEGRFSGEKENSKVFITKNQSIKIKHSDGKPETLNKPSVKRINETATPLRIIDISPEYQEEYNGWMNDVLVFDNSGFADIARALERKYDINIILADSSLISYYYTGTFKNIDDVYKVLDIIKETTPITYSLTGQNIIIKRTNQSINKSKQNNMR